MKKWFSLSETMRILNNDFGSEEFTLKKLSRRIKKGDLKALNISFENLPIWKIKKDWIVEFKKKVLKEFSEIPERFKPSPNEIEEAIYLPLSKKMRKMMNKQILNSYFPFLSKLEREVLSQRYGFDDGIFKSFEETGKKFGFSKQRAIELEQSAIKKMQERS